MRALDWPVVRRSWARVGWRRTPMRPRQSDVVMRLLKYRNLIRKLMKNLVIRMLARKRRRAMHMV